MYTRKCKNAIREEIIGSFKLCKNFLSNYMHIEILRNVIILAIIELLPNKVTKKTGQLLLTTFSCIANTVF